MRDLVCVLVIVGGCTGRLGNQASFELSDSAVGTSQQPSPQLESEAEQLDFIESFVHASTGTRCVDGDAQSWLVISREPVDCAQHAMWIDNPSNEALVARQQVDPQAAMQLQADQLCVGDGGCVSIEALNSRQGGWEVMTDGRRVTLDITVTDCDYQQVRPQTERTLARGVQIADVALYQGVRISLGSDTDVPIVADRPGLLRVFVQPQSGWTARPVTADLVLDGQTWTQSTQVFGASSEEALLSTFNFEVAEGSIKADSQFFVTLREQGACAPPGLEIQSPRFPEEQSFALKAQALETPLRVRLVPVRYGASGGGTANLSDATVQAYEQLLFGLYPVAAVDFEVLSPLAYEGVVGADGAGWSDLLTACMLRRAQDRPDNDVFYYCVVEPARDAEEYCGGACVAGLGIVSEAGDAESRVAVGLGYGAVSASTFVHEMGHSAGRFHAPCGPIAVDSVDSSFPNRDGRTGQWGYDVVTKEFFPPSSSDMMGYCPNQWISPHNFSGIFDRLSQVLDSRQALTGHGGWLMFTLDPNGVLQIKNGGNPVELQRPPGSVTPATLFDAQGQRLGEGEAFVARFNHLPGAIVHIPVPGEEVSFVSVPTIGTLLPP